MKSLRQTIARSSNASIKKNKITPETSDEMSDNDFYDIEPESENDIEDIEASRKEDKEDKEDKKDISTESSDESQPKEAPISAWKWTLLTIVTLIPIINIILVIAMVFVAKKQNIRNWAASRLHLCIITIALVVILFITGVIPQNVVSILKEEGERISSLIDYRIKGISKKGYSTSHTPTYKTSNGYVKVSIMFNEAMKEVTEMNEMHSTFLTLDGKAASIRVEESDKMTSEAELSSDSTRAVMPYTGQGLSGFVYGGSNGVTQMILRHEELGLNITVASEVDVESIYVERGE